MKSTNNSSIPCFIKEKFQGSYPCGNQVAISCYENVTRNEVDKYISTLKNSEYTIEQELHINQNDFITLLSACALVHVVYIHTSKTLNVLFDPLCETVYKKADISFEKNSQPDISIIPLDYSHREITDANGMSFVITLEDGRFIIIDGGYGDYVSNGEKRSSDDAKILYEYLQKRNNFPDKKIKIAAWIITHPHEDHYGAFVKFSKLYSNNVSVEYFIYNHGDPSTYSEKYPANQFLADRFPKIITDFYKNARVIKPHIGQSFKFCSTEIEFLHTHEACIPNIQPAPNDTSLVFKISFNNKSALFMADCDECITKLLIKTFGNHLKSDVLQINHHGYSGITKELFDIVNPAYTIWTTSKETFELRTNGEKYEFIGNAVDANKYIYDTLKKDACIVADKTIKQLIFNNESIILKSF